MVRLEIMSPQFHAAVQSSSYKNPTFMKGVISVVENKIQPYRVVEMRHL